MNVYGLFICVCRALTARAKNRVKLIDLQVCDSFSFSTDRAAAAARSMQSSLRNHEQQADLQAITLVPEGLGPS